MDSFRSVGVKVPYSSDGPFWALADGRKMLVPFGSHGRNLAFSCSSDLFLFAVLSLLLARREVVNRSASSLLHRRFVPWEIRSLQRSPLLRLPYF